MNKFINIKPDFGVTMPAGALPRGFSSLPKLMVWAPGEWVLCDDVWYESGDGRTFMMPRRFITDLASIPQIAQAVMPIDDETRIPSIFHDWLYCSKLLPREQCDELFLEALGRAGVGRTKSVAMYSAVRVGGWRYYNSRDGITQNDFAII